MTPRTAHLTWHPTAVDQAARERLMGHPGSVLWFTGLSGSGKSTLAVGVERALHARGVHTVVLDGDNVRHGLNRDLSFSPEDRAENIRRIGEVANLFARAGLVTLTAFISPYRADRDQARALLPPGRFVEIWCRCPLEVCEERDPKGLYGKARAGLIPDFTGISAPYEAPQHPDLVVETHHLTIEQSVDAVVAHLEAAGLL